jgi:DNA adenine methylase
MSSDSPAFHCINCNKTYKLKSGLDKHIATKHPATILPPLEQLSLNTNPITPAPILTPFLKWVGGKTQIIDDIITKFPRKINNYYEPFLGGGSVLFGLLTAIATNKIELSGTIYVSDLNAGLLATYVNIKITPELVIQEVTNLIDTYKSCPVLKGDITYTDPATIADALLSQENYYYWIRKQYNSLPIIEKQSPRGSAMFIFLNKTCFRGLYREGPHGFNVPFGNYKNPSIIDPEQIRRISSAIQAVDFTVCSFQTTINKARAGDFIYLDPPYALETKTSFVGYNANGFTPEIQAELFKLCRDITTATRSDVKIMMSNADVQIVKDAFPEPIFSTNIINCKRNINSKNPGATTNELIIRNY